MRHAPHFASTLDESRRAIDIHTPSRKLFNEDPGTIPGASHIAGVSACPIASRVPTLGATRDEVIGTLLAIGLT